jgi:hypothetical protein
MVVNDQGVDFSKDPSYNLSYQIVIRIAKMQDAKSNGNWEKYWWEFDSVMKICRPFFPDTQIQFLQEEYNKLHHAENVIREKFPNEKSQEKYLLELRRDFALTYEHIISLGLEGMDIIKLTQDGIIDFNAHDLKTLTKVVRYSSPQSREEIENELNTPRADTETDIENDTDE